MRFWSAAASALFFRSRRLRFGDFASSLCCFQLPPDTRMPDAVFLTRLAALRFVVCLGIYRSAPILRPSAPANPLDPAARPGRSLLARASPAPPRGGLGGVFRDPSDVL